jgi:hypothetical protein
MEQIILAIRQADEIDLGNTIINDPSAGRLTVEQAASTTSFILDSGNINLSVDGVNLGEAAKTSMEKIEELTLYLLEINEKIENQDVVLKEQQKLLEAQKLEIEQLKAKLNK